MAATAILTHMEELLALHHALLQAGEGKRQAMLDNEVSRLTEWVTKESRLMKQVTEAQNRWRDAIAAFLATRGMKPVSSLTVAQIAGMIAPEEGREQLLSLQEQLLGRIQELKELNQRNQQLIEKTLEVINYSVELFYGSEQETVYHNPHANHSASDVRNIRFDTRA